VFRALDSQDGRRAGKPRRSVAMGARENALRVTKIGCRTPESVRVSRTRLTRWASSGKATAERGYGSERERPMHNENRLPNARGRPSVAEHARVTERDGSRREREGTRRIVIARSPVPRGTHTNVLIRRDASLPHPPHPARRTKKMF